MTSAEFRQLRDRLGLSQAELGRLMGLHAREISRIETDRQPTRLQAAFIKHIAAARGKGE
ncbi:MAG: helix-turn-helix domain-containing protein [Desulfomicrobium apsheronum]|nr:helix-turn-helix domain-containing protein [Desulfomicrobium apsheronum]